MSDLISFGAGVNSVAMTILLVNEGWRGPIVFCDTGAEWPETYCYMDYFEREWLNPRGLAVTVLGAEWRDESSTASLPDFCSCHRTTPFAGMRWCTDRWKVRPLTKWAAAQGIETQLIGIASDERHRQKGKTCPLIDRGITRAGCIEIIKAAGLDVPQKSGCYICPFMRVDQWRELYRRHPELYERAANLERLSTERRGERTVLMVSGDRTLDDWRAVFDGQGSMLDDADWDGLLEYKPCVCGL